MRVGISLLWAREHRTGVENVAFNLINELAKLDGDDEYIVYANCSALPWLSSVKGGVRVVDVKPCSKRALWAWEHLFFLTNNDPKKMDLIHFPIGGGVFGYKGRYVLTIHDLKHFSDRHLVKLRRHLLWRIWCNANLPRAGKLIAVSEHVKQDILHNFALHPDRIKVIPNGVDLRFTPCTADPLFRARFNLPRRYVLFLGETTANKNIRRAIDAVHLVRTRHNADVEFIVAGLPGTEDLMLKRYVESNHLQNEVRFVGYVDDIELPQLYANASVFLFPSLSEGFGIPPLEAMRCGIPVVAARATCLPEVLGDSAVWVDPQSTESIAAGLWSALEDEKVRNEAIAKGFLRAEQFSWTKMALETVNVYRQVAMS
jgi:glycosyltransferase involved in cell wall biosynthesis